MKRAFLVETEGFSDKCRDHPTKNVFEFYDTRFLGRGYLSGLHETQETQVGTNCRIKR